MSVVAASESQAVLRTPVSLETAMSSLGNLSSSMLRTLDRNFSVCWRARISIGKAPTSTRMFALQVWGLMPRSGILPCKGPSEILIWSEAGCEGQSSCSLPVA